MIGPIMGGGWLVLSGDKEKNGSGTRRNQDHSVFDVSEPLQLADRLPGLLWRKAHLSAQLPVRVLVSDSAIGFGDRGELIENHSGGDLRCVHEQNTTDTRFGCKAKDLQIDITDEEWQPMQAGHKKAPASSDTGARRMRPPEGRTPSKNRLSGYGASAVQVG